MKIHEYQAKRILAEFGVATPLGEVATTVEEAVAAAENIGAWPVVVKAQVHVGGRGKAGGVKLAKSMDELKDAASKILGLNIKGIVVRKVLIEPGIDIKREIYLGIIMDRGTKRPVIMASAEGGVEIEEVAKETPEKILKLGVPPFTGLRSHHIVRLWEFLDIPEAARKSFGAIVKGLVKAFFQKDCSLAEINPLVITGSGQVIACDAKMNFDDNALPWHKELDELRDDGEEEPLEVEARAKKLNYVKLDGQIGCIVNGAGLAMCTMDVVKHFGGSPANFLDIGGGAKAEQVADALKLITSDPHVNTIFFNVFGGIVRCDNVAKGILLALEQLPDFDYPIVIRLSGTNEEKARQMLEGSPLKMAPNMAEGAKMAVEIAKSR
ncbi:ADP-forming succinate--CoA ligase subunit beta [bacterium]|nr:ADP-forming succinate--CoA ligase subunit beta [bacterium]